MPYFKADKLINGRPYYVNSAQTRAYWFDGDSGKDADWWRGDLTDVLAGNYNIGYMQSDGDFECPSVSALKCFRFSIISSNLGFLTINLEHK